MKLTTDHLAFQLVCAVTGILLLSFADEGRLSYWERFYHWVLSSLPANSVFNLGFPLPHGMQC